MSCGLEEEKREKLKSEVEKVWMEESKQCGNLPFNMRVILAPFTIKKLNQEQANKILNFGFSFLSSLSKNF